MLSAKDLKISEAQRNALIKTLFLLEDGCLLHVKNTRKPLSKEEKQFSGLFNMDIWNRTTECGTVCCIGGTAEQLGGVVFDNITEELTNLFYPNHSSNSYTNDVIYGEITPNQAAQALRSYLETGAPNWRQIENMPYRTRS